MLVRCTPRSTLFFQELAALGKQMQSNTSTATEVRTQPPLQHVLNEANR